MNHNNKKIFYFVRSKLLRVISCLVIQVSLTGLPDCFLTHFKYLFVSHLGLGQSGLIYRVITILVPSICVFNINLIDNKIIWFPGDNNRNHLHNNLNNNNRKQQSLLLIRNRTRRRNRISSKTEKVIWNWWGRESRCFDGRKIVFIQQQLHWKPICLSGWRMHRSVPEMRQNYRLCWCFWWTWLW